MSLLESETGVASRRARVSYVSSWRVAAVDFFSPSDVPVNVTFCVEIGLSI